MTRGNAKVEDVLTKALMRACEEPCQRCATPPAHVGLTPERVAELMRLLDISLLTATSALRREDIESLPSLLAAASRPTCGCGDTIPGNVDGALCATCAMVLRNEFDRLRKLLDAYRRFERQSDNVSGLDDDDALDAHVLRTYGGDK